MLQRPRRSHSAGVLDMLPLTTRTGITTLESLRSRLACYSSCRPFHLRSRNSLYVAVVLEALENIVRLRYVHVADAFAHHEHIVPALHRALRVKMTVGISHSDLDSDSCVIILQ